MRDAVTIRGVAAAREGFTDDGTVSVLTITATFDSPEKAQGVAHEFAQRTIAISASSRIEQARETLGLLPQPKRPSCNNRWNSWIAKWPPIAATMICRLEGGLEFRQTQIGSLNDAILGIERERIDPGTRAVAAGSDPARLAPCERQTREIEAQLKILTDQEALLDRTDRQPVSRPWRPARSVQRQLDGFERRREKLQGELDVISTRRAEAEVGFKLEEQNQSERLTVIEEAAFPDYPITRSRKSTAMMGGFAQRGSGP